MTGNDLRKARTRLGELWGLGRPAFATELGKALRNPASDPGEMIRNHEADRDGEVPWLLAAAVEMLLNCSLPPGGVPR